MRDIVATIQAEQDEIIRLDHPEVLGDALLCAQAVPSLPQLSLEPVCRRSWGSV